VLASGHVTHNPHEAITLLRRGDAKFAAESGAADHIEAHRRWVENTLRRQSDDNLAAWLKRSQQARRAHPSDEPILLLRVPYGAANAQVEPIDLGTEAQVLAMDGYVFTRH
jgi:4,5-DOPA dioxygenase extradiol